jgi:hypothetical protein
LACVGGGPLYQLAGRIPLYAPPNLDNWATSRLSPVVKNTAEYGNFPEKRPQEKLSVKK